MVKRLVQRHLRFTGSEVARRLLLNWEREKRAFVKVGPGAAPKRTPCLPGTGSCLPAYLS